ncbi:MAG: hypothetical protein ACKPDI_15450 [Actinomycetota bacterium]
MTSPDDLIDEARRHATAICSAQVAESGAASHDELLRVLDRIGEDPNRLYALYRVLTGAVAAMALAAADDLAAGEPNVQRAYALTMVRDVIANLELAAR